MISSVDHLIIAVNDLDQATENYKKIFGISPCWKGKRNELGTKNVLFGTQAIFSEGISIDNLSCLILGTPINNEPLLTQLIGRVIRKQEKKLSPVVVDIHLLGNTAKRQASNRVGYYKKQGWEMKYI